MFSLKFKILLTGSLILVTVMLGIIMLVYGGDDEESGTVQTFTGNLTAEEYRRVIPAEIDTILYSFGIRNEWIKDMMATKDEKKPVNKKIKKEPVPPIPENLWFYKEVSVPEDLSVSALNYELTNFFHTYKLSEIINEDPKTRDLNIDIYHSSDSTKKVLGKLKVVYTEKLDRGAAEVCIILNNVNQYAEGDIAKILGSPEKFSLVLPVSFENSDIQSNITESGKDYVLYYSIGNENDFESDFRTDMDEKQWKGKVRSITAEFQQASGVLLSNSRRLFKFESDILDHFSKYRPDVYKDTILYKFNPGVEGEKKIYELFSSILSNSAAGRKSLVYLVDMTMSEFMSYTNEVYNMRKRGYKFTTFKDITRPKDKKKETAAENNDSTKTQADIKGKGEIKK